MSKRLLWALAAYAVLALLAAFTLDGLDPRFKYGLWILLGGLAAKTVIAHKARW